MQVNRVLDDLIDWISSNGFSGWDPYDIKGHPLYRRILMNPSKNVFFRAYRKGLFELAEKMPLTARKILNIQPQINAKGLSLMALSYIKLYKITNEDIYLSKFLAAWKWLANNNHTGNDKQLGWGYPFDWQSFDLLIPANTPLCVPTVFGGHALLEYRKITGETSFDVNLHKIKNFLVHRLNKRKFNDTLCFSYSELDDYMVVNANLYVASFLTRYGSVFNDLESLELSRQARRFSILQQEEEGQWPYWAHEYGKGMPYLVDNYHTGITLQWLSVCRAYDDIDVGDEKAIKKGLSYYVDHLFDEDGVPCFSDKNKFPVDIHSSAQAFVTFNELNALEHKDLALKTFEFTCNKLLDSRGYFYHKLERSGYVSKLPYMRWAQCWMLYGLVNLLEYKEKVNVWNSDSSK